MLHVEDLDEDAPPAFHEEDGSPAKRPRTHHIPDHEIWVVEEEGNDEVCPSTSTYSETANPVVNRDGAIQACCRGHDLLASKDLDGATRMANKSLALAETAAARELLRDIEQERRRALQAAAVKRICDAGGDHFAVLGIDRAADADAVHSAFRALSRSVHPDKNTAPGAEAAFQTLSHARTTLADPDLRSRYQTLHPMAGRPAQPGAPAAPPPATAPVAARATAPATAPATAAGAPGAHSDPCFVARATHLAATLAALVDMVRTPEPVLAQSAEAAAARWLAHLGAQAGRCLAGVPAGQLTRQLQLHWSDPDVPSARYTGWAKLLVRVLGVCAHTWRLNELGLTQAPDPQAAGDGIGADGSARLLMRVLDRAWDTSRRLELHAWRVAREEDARGTHGSGTNGLAVLCAALEQQHTRLARGSSNPLLLALAPLPILGSSLFLVRLRSQVVATAEEAARAETRRTAMLGGRHGPEAEAAAAKFGAAAAEGARRRLAHREEAIVHFVSAYGAGALPLNWAVQLVARCAEIAPQRVLALLAEACTLPLSACLASKEQVVLAAFRAARQGRGGAEPAAVT